MKSRKVYYETLLVFCRRLKITSHHDSVWMMEEELHLSVK
jgi:hypothetical protein